LQFVVFQEPCPNFRTFFDGYPSVPNAAAGLASLTFVWPGLCDILIGVWVRDAAVFSSFSRAAGNNARVTAVTLLPFLFCNQVSQRYAQLFAVSASRSFALA
jgi:hypothetical protein